MKKFLTLLAAIALIPVSANAFVCTKIVPIYTGTDLTSPETGTYIKTPQGYTDYYIRYDLTEDTAGSITLEVNSNTTASATNDVVNDNGGGAQSATAVNYVNRNSTSGQNHLGPFIGVDVTAVTGQWDVVVEVVFCK